MKKEIEILQEIFSAKMAENCPVSLLPKLWDAYNRALEQNPFPPMDLNSKGYRQVIDFLKRERANEIGIYDGITIFEAANRIASDLVLLEGLPMLASQTNATHFGFSLGNHQREAHGDFYLTIKGEKHHGEVFSTAKSFFSGKLSQTKRKWKWDQEGASPIRFLMFNSSAREDKIGKASIGWKEHPRQGNVVVWESTRLTR